jgi:hypothetical protein
VAARVQRLPLRIREEETPCLTTKTLPRGQAGGFPATWAGVAGGKASGTSRRGEERKAKLFRLSPTTLPPKKQKAGFPASVCYLFGFTLQEALQFGFWDAPHISKFFAINLALP